MKKIFIYILTLSLFTSCISNKGIFNKRKYTSGKYRSTADNYKFKPKKQSKVHYIFSDNIETKKEDSSDTNSIEVAQLVVEENIVSESKGKTYIKKREDKKSFIEIDENFDLENESIQSEKPLKQSKKADVNSGNNLLFIALCLLLVGILFILIVSLDIIPISGLGLLLALIGFLSIIASVIVLIIFLASLFLIFL